MDKKYPDSEVTDLRRRVSKQGMEHYVTETEILKDHPCNSEDPLVYDTYDAALWLVGERHAKYDLVALVNHLLLKIANVEKLCDEKKTYCKGWYNTAPYGTATCEDKTDDDNRCLDCGSEKPNAIKRS